ncbi:MAG TPA: LAGLIDADG family homing endonuclease [Conexivisphaerales archaeon]|nr:LAGLIDADG family homing endonuclease [Conexivisphaerales archaeon]
MNPVDFVKGFFSALYSGGRQLFKRRMTLRYPEAVAYPVEGMYGYDPKKGVASNGWRGKHYLDMEKCTGCQLCALACENIAEAIEMVPVDVKYPQNKKEIYPSVDYGRCVFCGFCVDPSTPVVTNPGLKPISQVAVGDLLLTHTGEYRPVTKVWDMEYSGPLYHIYVYGRPEPLICTKDHPIMAVSRPRSSRKDGRLLRVTSPIRFYTPNELKAGDYMLSPVVKKLVRTDYFEKDVPMYRGNVSTGHLKLPASPELFRLIGYFIAEGFCDGGRSVKFSFHVKEKELIDDVRRLCATFFSKEPKVRKNTGLGVNVVLDSALAEDFFSQFGHGAENKKLPDWVFFAEDEKLIQLLKGIWLGDGCRIHRPRQEYFNFTTTSEVLAFQVQEILARLGVVGLIEGQHQRGRLPSYHVNVFGRWVLKLSSLFGVGFARVPSKFADKFHLDDNYSYLPIKKIEVEDVKEYRVMDVTVEEDHTFSPLGLATSNCVDACPFYALFMTNDMELSELKRNSLFYTPLELYRKPELINAKKQKWDLDPVKGAHHE